MPVLSSNRYYWLLKPTLKEPKPQFSHVLLAIRHYPHKEGLDRLSEFVCDVTNDVLLLYHK